MEEIVSQAAIDLDESIRIISREMVNQFAAEEMDLFDELYSQFQRDPAKFKQKVSSDDPLEFGFDEILVTYAPVIISMVSAVLNKLFQILMQSVQGETESMIQEKTKEVFQRLVKGENKDPYQSELMKFSEQELAALHQLGVQEGISYGLSAKEASNVMSHLRQRIAATQQN
jgi:hypothetical protein